jgi:replicative DNA helicase
MDLPYDIKAERGIICTLIIYPEFIVQSENLNPSFFYDNKNGSLYWAIQNLIQQGIDKIDALNLITTISSNSGVQKLMGDNLESQLNDIIENADLLARNSIEEYKVLANQVIGLGFKRELYKRIKQIENKCLISSTDDISELNTEVMDIVNNMAIKYITKENICDFSNKVDNLWDNLISKRNSNGTFGILPKWKELEDYFTYQEGELTLICARRKHGKSVVALNETVHKLKCGIPVVYFDTEMKDDLFFTRLLSHVTQIPEKRIKNGNYSDEEAKIIDDAKIWIKKQPLIHEYNPRWTKEAVVTQAKILHNKGKLGFFIYDYIKDTSGKNTSSSEQYNELGNWCDSLKNGVCGALSVAGLTFAQLNRQMQIADSDKVERYVTTGITWREKTEEEIMKDGKECGNYAMTVDFNRIGESHEEGDYIDFLFKKEVLTIETCKTQHKQDETPFN